MDPFSPPINLVAEYLVGVFETTSNKYSAMRTRISALSAFLPLYDGFTVGKHSAIKRIMTAIFKKRPSLPRYTETYDANIVLEHLKTLGDNKDIGIKDLTHRLVTLLGLLSGQRGQTLQAINKECIYITDDVCTIMISSVLKTTGPAFHTSPLKFNKYPSDSRICAIENIIRYMDLTADVRGENSQLFLSYVKPYHPIGIGTIRRWIVETLTAAGIDTKTYTAHSTRSAATSKAFANGATIIEICRAAGWKNCPVFAKHYKRDIVTVTNFADTIYENTTI